MKLFLITNELRNEIYILAETINDALAKYNAISNMTIVSIEEITKKVYIAGE